MQNELKTLIDNSTYVSFDIFDTAVTRSVLKPVDVFTLVEKISRERGNELTFDYKTVRLKSERKAREKAWRMRFALRISSFMSSIRIV